MLLAIDVGNTNTVLGVFDANRLRDSFRVQTEKDRTGDEYGLQIKSLFDFAGLSISDVHDVIVSSVVPPMAFPLEQMCKRFFGRKPLFVGPGVKTGMPGPQGLVIVDFGTATTFDAVTPKGEYLGGAIAPGIAISMEALFHRASKLPRVGFEKPEHVVGRNTVASMQSGLVYGYVGLVDGICARMKDELGFPVKVVATGGLAPLIGSVSRQIEVVDDQLTLDGLRIIYQRNAGDR